MVRRWFDEKSNRPYKDYLVSTFTELSAWQMGQALRRKRRYGGGHKRRQAGAEDREEEEEELPCPGSVSSVGATGPQSAHLLRAMVFGRDQGKELGVERLVREVMRMPAEVRIGRRGEEGEAEYRTFIRGQERLPRVLAFVFLEMDGIPFGAKVRCQHFSISAWTVQGTCPIARRTSEGCAPETRVGPTPG